MAVPNSRTQHLLPSTRKHRPVLMPPPTTHTDSRHLVELRRTPRSGLGIFALHPIPRGTRILLERPLLSIPDSSPNPAADILTAYSRLPSTSQALFLTLHRFADSIARLAFAVELDTPWATLDPLARDVLATWCTNALPTGVFVLGSRFNHSCTPNVFTTHNAAVGGRTFHAVKDIKVGEELTISYVASVHRHKEHRVARLKKWDFECECEACGETGKAVRGEGKRVEAWKLEVGVVEAVKRGAWGDVRDRAVRLGDLQVQVGCVGWELGATCLEGARAHLMLGDVKEAVKWTKRVLEVNTRCAGADHPVVRQLKMVIARMEGALQREGIAFVDESVLKWFDGICGARRENVSAMSSGVP